MYPRIILSKVSIIVCIWAGLGNAQDFGYITGMVIDSLSAPIEGAVAEIRYGIDYDTSDSHGMYLLGPLPAGRSRLSISSENLEEFFERLDIPAGETLIVNVMLGTGCAYLPGDISNNGIVDSLDFAILYRYFHGDLRPRVDCGDPYGPCPFSSPYYAAGDANGTCSINGVDMSFLISYLHGGSPPIFCASCPPASRRIP